MMKTNRKTIVHVVEDLRIGGLERVIQTIALGLDKGKYRVEVWCLAEGGQIADELSDEGIAVKILGMKSYYNPRRILELALLLQETEVDLIHSHGYFASTFARVAGLKAGRAAMVRHMHTTDHRFSPRNMRIEALLSLYTDQVICVSQAVKTFAVEALGIPDIRTCVIYNTAFAKGNGSQGVDLEKRRAALGIGADDFVILALASLKRNKGHAVLLHAARQLRRKHPGIKCLIVGDGPLRGDLESEAEQLGLSGHVAFTGLQNDVTPYLDMAHALVLPTLYREGLSVALIEGASAGLPLVGSRLGGIPEVIEHRENGFLVRPGDAGNLAAAIGQLIANPDLQGRMGRASREIYTNRFSQGIILRRIEALYDRLLKARSHEA
jgi:glycosyltransferase involved in cell wall biosynthesis